MPRRICCAGTAGIATSLPLVYQHPFFSDDIEASTLSGTYEVIGGANVKRGTDLTYSLPIAYFRVEGEDLRTAPANATLGLRLVDRSWTDRAQWAVIGVTSLPCCAGIGLKHSEMNSPWSRTPK